MSVGSSLEPAKRQAFPKFLFLLILVILIVPHALRIEHLNAIDNWYQKYDLFAFLWMLTYSYGSTIAGPFYALGISLPGAEALFWSALALPASVFIFLVVRRFSRRVSTNRLRWTVVAFLILWTFLLGGFTTMADGFWSWTVFPLPLQQISAAAVAWYLPSDIRKSRET
jgi:hypothetical protein